MRLTVERLAWLVVQDGVLGWFPERDVDEARARGQAAIPLENSADRLDLIRRQRVQRMPHPLPTALAAWGGGAALAAWGGGAALAAWGGGAALAAWGGGAALAAWGGGAALAAWGGGAALAAWGGGSVLSRRHHRLLPWLLEAVMPQTVCASTG